MSSSLKLVNEYSFLDLLYAYFDCRTRKRNKVSAIGFETNFERNLDVLQEHINTGLYVIGRSKVFVSTHPKAREVWAAGFRDRIVHHLIYSGIGQWYEDRFIADTYSCIKERGTLRALKRAEKFARSITENWQKPAWCLQMDIANFFVSINKGVLWEVMQKDIGENTLTSRLINQVIFADPTVNAIYGTPHLMNLVPEYKSLLHCPKGYGLPIGNLTSQFFSNVYLDAFDKFVKHTLKVKQYVRYVDDMVAFSTDRDELYYIKDSINAWLKEHRCLHLHPNKVSIKPASAGINFVGGIILPFRTYPRNMVFNSASKAAHELKKHPSSSGAFDTCNSYIGMMRPFAAYNKRKRLCEAVNISTLIAHDAQMTKLVRL